MTKKGIDISYCQPIVDFQKVKDSGIDFVILRAGFGRLPTQVDHSFLSHYKNAKAVGLNVGVYWYSYATSVQESKLEANAFLQVIEGKQFEYPGYFDQEDKTLKSLPKQLLTDIAKTFMTIVQQAGYFVGLYTNPDWLKNRQDINQLKDFDVWLAHWKVPEVNKYNVPHGIWQYNVLGSETEVEKGNATAIGCVPGVNGSIDVDYSYKDYPAIIKKAGLNGFKKLFELETLKTENTELKNKLAIQATRINELEAWVREVKEAASIKI